MLLALDKLTESQASSSSSDSSSNDEVCKKREDRDFERSPDSNACVEIDTYRKRFRTPKFMTMKPFPASS